MPRLTRAIGKKKGYIVNEALVIRVKEGYTGEAIEKLARFENALEALMVSQTEVSEELERLRSEDKTKSVRFKELMVKKMTNATMIAYFKSRGLE
ncbi:MAG: hypothetical protein ACM3PP_10175 [Candidatus Saccharibacteria bacterium]